jgi:hypothetical protein
LGITNGIAKKNMMRKSKDFPLPVSSLTPGPSPRIFLAEKSWRGVPKRWIFDEKHPFLAPLSIVEAAIERSDSAGSTMERGRG